jgi:dsRNA-specific ribonuclease
MGEQPTEVLYYPNFDPNDLAGIKQSLLLYDKVNLIAPQTTPLMGRLLADSPGEELSQISGSGALSESWSLPSALSVVNMIPDEQIVRDRWDEFLAALSEDLADEEVLAWELQWKARNAGKEVSWYVLPSYFSLGMPVAGSPEHQIQEIYDKSLGLLMRVPFLVGMSLGLSEALWAAVDRGYTLFTDDDASQDFLMLRLKRGWKRLSRDPELRHAFAIEPEFASKVAVAYLGAWILQSKVPEAIKNASNLSVPEILELRQTSNQKNALEKFRKGIRELVQSQDLWEHAKFADFENEAYKIYSNEILPAFEELENRSVHLKDIFKVFDVNDAVSKGIKAIPDLFVSAGVPTAMGTGAALLARHPVAPAALLALGCGVAAYTVPKLISEISGRLGKRRSAQFLAYPLRLQKALVQNA